MLWQLMNRGINIRTDLTPGDHILRCEVLAATADPGGGHEFRIISVMRYVLFYSCYYLPSSPSSTISPFISFLKSNKGADDIVCNDGLSKSRFLLYHGIYFDIDLDGQVSITFRNDVQTIMYINKCTC